MTLPSRYGAGLGPYRPIPGEEIPLSLAAAGINIAKDAADITEGESPNALDVLFQKGGVSSDYGLTLLGTAYAGAGDKTIIHIAEFKRKDLTTVLVRMRPAGWDRWNGATWFSLTMAPALSGIATDRLYSTVMQDKLIVAPRNGTDRIKAWDGTDGDAVDDLSADAPICHYLAPMGQRLVAARIKSGAAIDPYLIKWSADGIITDWTNPANGAGSIVLEPEGKTGASEHITGLSALETALVVYRNRSIVLGTRTGLGAAPFRWATVIFGLGTDSPYSIANGGVTLGDFFLGSDFNVYLFNGREVPIPVGEPIYRSLRSQITDPSMVIGIMDRRNEEYWLMVPTAGSTVPNIAWIFSVRDFLLNRRLSWRKKSLTTGYPSGGFGSTVGAANPVVDSVNLVVDTVGVRVDEFGSQAAPQQVLVGDANGGVWYSDESTFVAGNYETKILGDAVQEIMIDRVQVHYTARNASSFELSISTDGGQTWAQPQVFSVGPTQWTKQIGAWFSKVVNLYQLRIRILSGDITIPKMVVYVYPRGRAAA